MIQQHSYVIAVPDLARSSAFYRDVLDFEIREMASGWLLYVKDSCQIMAGECRDAMPARATGDHSYFGYLVVDDVDEYHRRVAAASAEIVKPLRAEPWGMREFGLRTVDGHRLMIASPLRSVAPKPEMTRSPEPRGAPGVAVSVFVGTSVDGFLARPHGELDFLPDDAEPHGYDEFIAGVDAIVIGRKTYETVLTFGSWPYGPKRVVVLSRHPLDLTTPRSRGAVVDQMGGEPAEIVSRLAASGVNRVYLDGGLAIQGFLRAGLVDRLIITRVPVLIGEGIPLFGSLPSDIRLHHVQTRSFPSGLVQTEYEVGLSGSKQDALNW